MARFEYASDASIAGMAPAGSGPQSADDLFELGLMYCAGRDVELDLVKAHKWFNLAAMRGSEAARRYRMEIGRELSRVEMARAQRLAREWIAKN
jgi:hypothetical protein